MRMNTLDIGRRRLLQAAGASAALMALPATATPTAGKASATALSGYSRRARAIVERALVIDMLAPLRIDLREDAYAEPLSAGEIADFRRSGITAMHHSWGIEGPDAHIQVLAHMAGWYGLIAHHADLFVLVRGVADLERAKADGKVAVIFGVQNADHFRGVDDVKLFHGMGQRCAQLTYNSQNLIASGSTDRVDGGVSDFGAAIIAGMESTGMLVDVSHCGPRTTLDAIEIARGPIAITHSNCQALLDHPRLKSDEAIRRLAAKGGVIGITGVRMFVTGAEPTTIEHIVDHIDHVARLVGIEHVGIGSDADLYGYDAMPAEQLAQLKAAYKASYGFRDRIDIAGFDHPLKIYDLVEALIRRGYGDTDIALVLGGNFRRLLGQVWR